MKVTKLSEMRIRKIALVKSPANMRRFLLFKSNEPISKPGFEETKNEIRYRVRDPKDFKKNAMKNGGTFAPIDIVKKAPRVRGLIGKLKKGEATVLQSLRFPKDDKWTIAKAKKWVDAHPDVIKKKFSKGGDDMGEDEKKEEQVVKAVDETVLNESLDTLTKAVEGIANLFTVEKADPSDDPDPEKKEGEETTAEDLEKKGAAISAGNKKKIEDVIKILQALVTSAGGNAPSADDKAKTKKAEDSESEISKEIDAVTEQVGSLVSKDEFKDQLKGVEEKVAEALK